MEKKIYAEPAMTVEFFTPKQYVASCDDWVPSDEVFQKEGLFWADIAHDNGYTYSKGPDGIVNEATVESFANGHASTTARRNGLTGWFEHMTLYTRVGGYNAGSSRYNNTSIMRPLTGYENVALFISSKGQTAWIYKGEGGSAPSVNPDSSDFKTMS